MFKQFFSLKRCEQRAMFFSSKRVDYVHTFEQPSTRTIEQHDRDFARQSHPPTQNHLRRVSSMTSDFYWHSWVDPRPLCHLLKQRLPLGVSVFTESLLVSPDHGVKTAETWVLSRMTANITQPNR